MDAEILLAFAVKKKKKKAQWFSTLGLRPNVGSQKMCNKLLIKNIV